MIDFTQMDITIVSWNRPAQLQALADRFAATAPAYRTMRVLVNHPDGAQGFTPPPRCTVVPTGRPPEHAGCMAKSWNLAMQWAFRDPSVQWLLCAMDDLQIHPGWANCFARYDADLYLAPAGDVGFVFHRKVLAHTGWFDERYTVIGFQEWDWQARAIRALGLGRVSLDDAHGWHHNPVGLSAFWHHDGSASARQRNGAIQLANERWLIEKWGLLVPQVNAMLRSGQVSAPKVPEIEWYPWFTK